MDSRRVDELDAEICRLARQMHSESYRMLELVRDFDDRMGYAKWSHKSCADWLAWRLQISRAAAREKVRTAQALRYLPKISAAFADGHISYTKARELTRVAGEHGEEPLLAYALNATAPQVTERCRQIRNVLPESKEEARRAWEQRSLTAARNPAHNTMLISVELPAEDGEIVLRALECAVSSGEVVALGVDHLAAHGEERSKTDGWSAQQADALVAMARAYLAGDVGRGGELVEPAMVEGYEAGEIDGGDAIGAGEGVEAGEGGEPADVDEKENATAVAFFMSNDADRARSTDDGMALDGTAATNGAATKTLAGPYACPRGTSVADHYQIIVHVDEKALRSWECSDGGAHGAGTECSAALGREAAPRSGEAPRSSAAPPPPPRSDLPLETIRRLTCDCSLIALVEDDNGKPLGISRKKRLVSRHLRRALLARDRGCTFPGCHRAVYLDAHHIKHWIDRGETVPDNTTLQCTFHHRLLHEGGFSIRKRHDGTLDFLRPDGRVIPRSGYKFEDMVDTDVAQVHFGDDDWRDSPGVREAPGVYCARSALLEPH